MRLGVVFVAAVYIYRVQLEKSNTVNWNTDDGDKIPTIEIGFEGEVFKIPLREAPFCHLWETHKCLCYMLRKDRNSSDWSLASFSYCGGDIGGHFLNSTDYFEIETIGTGSSREFNVTKFPTTENYTEWIIDDVGDEEEMPNIRKSSFHYFKPLSESRLRDYETGFLSCLFVIDRRIFRFQRKKKIDFFLQNLINDANEFLHEFSFVAVYRGWKLAEAYDLDLKNVSYVDRFINYRHRHYIDKDGHYLVFLFTVIVPPERSKLLGRTLRRSICRASTGIYLKYHRRRGKVSMRQLIKTFTHEIGHTLRLCNSNETACKEPPEGKIFIMQKGINYTHGELIWSACSKDVVEKSRQSFICLREKVKPPRPSCRNGVLEEGEQCECVSKVCRKCCDDKCQLTEGSECSSGPCCDEATCKPRTKDEEYRCRKAKDSCDIPEMCDGDSIECPANYVVADGYQCGDSSNQGYCFRGMCGSRPDVCSWVYGDGKVGEESCFQHNLEDNSDFGCGPSFTDPNRGANFACRKRDMYCGKIFCIYRKKTTSEFEIALSEQRIVRSTIGDCSFLEIGNNTRSLREDPTFVQNGSECGNEKMCVKQKCVSLPAGCPKNCPGELVQHPDTHEWLPAYILPDPDDEPHENDDKPGGLGLFHWFFTIFSISCLILMVFLVLQSKISTGKQSGKDAPIKT
ncbi:zinc metalloproteinase-disintegrin-like EoMP06 [Brevipalpus obovatus]|uniref:zinc metalloproteinase-disintegrin-like EoMP06 n=1 Tax=Brevipalpus obovatus TaxID=246614 RepID=UPI003D9F2F2F